ncbi:MULTISPECIES: FadR/GntR family transcriptional regulator [Actinomycetes]|uniref:FadR/GntR family transcriptional regulator n=2 Tax=Actinomycetes TaxID=1760 RepID=A0ABP6M5U3_9MICC|nr:MULTISPECIES: FadR/GntR family transcriptional regulator [unclassified Nesterenkonia]MDS2172778.1 FadR/GntR family transcriptional regulator [Nesterenkonia sp. CL21]OSM43214.1 hypothetical protein BCY76_009745 [Nesterenkonia sp. PF2B19]
MRELDGLSISSVTVAEQLSRRLISMIEDGELKAGDKLPNERALAESAEVSRTTVREALRDLELRGLITRTRGRGTVVRAVRRPDLHAGMLGSMETSHRVLREVMDLRAVVEPPMAERAADRALDSELPGLLHRVEQAEEELARPDPSVPLLFQLDMAFHSEIAKLTHNPMLTRLLNVTHDWMTPSEAGLHLPDEKLRTAVEAHRRIYEAIRRHDADEARRLMAEHLEEVAAHLDLQR